MQKVLSEVAEAKLMKMSTARWFSYVHCLPGHLKHWNARHLLVLTLGMRLGVYRDQAEFPLRAGPKAKRVVAVDQEEPAEERERRGQREML